MTALTWPDEKTDELRALWKKPEMSASKIAAVIGYSRSAVLAKVKRLRDAGLLEDPTARRIPGPRAKRDRTDNLVAYRKPPERPAPPTIPEIGGVTIMQLSQSTCRFPYEGRPNGEQLYCGRSVEAAGSAFCVGHAARVYTKKPLARL